MESSGDVLVGVEEVEGVEGENGEIRGGLWKGWE